MTIEDARRIWDQCEVYHESTGTSEVVYLDGYLTIDEIEAIYTLLRAGEKL